MLRGIRKASSNWVGKTIMSVVMGVLILSFAVWGIADIFKGFGQSTLAKIGRTEISTDQFRQIYTEKLQQIGRQFGRPLTQDQARAFGIDRQVLQQVVAEAALDENARRLGLGQSDAETMRMIYSDPNFKGPTGAFDAGRFQQTIRQFGYTEQRYIADQRRVALRRQIAGTITTGLEPSKTLVEAMSRFQSEQRAIDYLKLEAAQIGAIEPPSSEALAGFYEDHKSQFRAPEYRKLSFVTVTPEAIAKWASVSDEDARKVFEQRREKLATPERRQVSQIVFQNGEEAQSARTRIAGGLSFDDLVKERNLSSSDVDLGNVTKAGIIDPKVADAAFALPVDEVSQPVQGRFGVALIKVGKIEPGIQPSYESVAAALKRDIATERARAEVQDLHNKMEDARGGGASVIESSQRLGLTPVTIEAIDRSGRGPDGQPVAGIPQGIDLASAAFASDVGVDNESLPVAGGYLWFDVLGITPSRERSLDDVKAQVESRWRTEQVTSRLRTRAAEMVRKLAQGGTLADEAKAAGVKLETATGLKRDGAVPGVPTAVIEAAFKTLKDGVGQTQGGTGAEWFVFRVTDVTVPPLDLASEDARKIKDSLIRRMGDEQVGQHVARLETEIGTTINEAAVAQVTGAATN
jgi:peptidyl-prolyl cis-trans isomerase D